MKVLDKSKYIELTKKLEGEHWKLKGLESRWDYHNKAVSVISGGGADPSKVLEMGTMGLQCVIDSHTIDFIEKWDFEGKAPTYVHDGRVIPWPIKSDSYDIFVALRVFMHLAPMQEQAFNEAFRVARKVLIVVPETYDNKVHDTSKGITYEQFVHWRDGIHPNLYIPTRMGWLYLWDRENPSKIDWRQLVDYRGFVSSEAPIHLRVLRKLKTVLRAR